MEVCVGMCIDMCIDMPSACGTRHLGKLVAEDSGWRNGTTLHMRSAMAVGDGRCREPI